MFCLIGCNIIELSGLTYRKLSEPERTEERKGEGARKGKEKETKERDWFLGAVREIGTALDKIFQVPQIDTCPNK
jgi:ribosomal protein L19E